MYVTKMLVIWVCREPAFCNGLGSICRTGRDKRASLVSLSSETKWFKGQYFHPVKYRQLQKYYRDPEMPGSQQKNNRTIYLLPH